MAYKQENIFNSEHQPLAARMRPQTLDEFIGQNHIIGAGRLLRRAIKADQLSSLIFYGPPGTGKTTLAQIIANTTKSHFISINAVLAGVKDIRQAIEDAKIEREKTNKKTILFIDEVHRFNKSQQDALLPHVENGTLILIGATTENPYFEVNKALVSRSRIFQLKPLNDQDIKKALINAINNKEKGYGKLNIKITDDALEHLVRVSNGDARSSLNALELAVETTPELNGVINIGLEEAEESIQRKAVLYDKDGDTHYDTISAFIKSIRGSDPDAALYWMAKMVYAGEDPRFIFRRMIILASEDIGLADPNALNVIISAARAYDYVGMPEGQFHLSHACLYLATAPKSNSTMAFFDALESVKSEKDADVPNHLKDGNRDKHDLGHGKGYIYPHSYREHWVAQQYLPDTLQGKMFYEPSEIGYEKNLKDKVISNRELQMFARDSWQDNFIDIQKDTGLKNNWLNRALIQTGELLGKVRDEIFTLAQANRESLLLDLTGSSGFITWEACRRSFAGGVWSRVESYTKKNEMEDWIRHIQILNRPELFLSDLDNIKIFFDSLNDKPEFDVIIGYDILTKVKNRNNFIDYLKTLLEKKGKIILAEKFPVNSQMFSDILGKEVLGNKLYSKINNIEKEMREKEINHFNNNIFSNFKIFIKDFYVKRHFSYIQIQKWFELTNDKNSNSIFSILKNELPEKDFNFVQSKTFDCLGDKDINWKQSFEFIYAIN